MRRETHRELLSNRTIQEPSPWMVAGDFNECAIECHSGFSAAFVVLSWMVARAVGEQAAWCRCAMHFVAMQLVK